MATSVAWRVLGCNARDAGSILAARTNAAANITSMFQIVARKSIIQERERKGKWLIYCFYKREREEIT